MSGRRDVIWVQKVRAQSLFDFLGQIQIEYINKITNASDLNDVHTLLELLL